MSRYRRGFPNLTHIAFSLLMLLAWCDAAGAAVIEGSADASVIYSQSCASCHGIDLGGGTGPALKGPNFDARWRDKERSLHDLMSSTMPLSAPGSLAPMAYKVLTGYLLNRGPASPTTSDSPSTSE